MKIEVTFRLSYFNGKLSDNLAIQLNPHPSWAWIRVVPYEYDSIGIVLEDPKGLTIGQLAYLPARDCEWQIADAGDLSQSASRKMQTWKESVTIEVEPRSADTSPLDSPMQFEIIAIPRNPDRSADSSGQ
jgi:hypothetical protein